MPTLSLANVNYGSFSFSAPIPGGGYVFVAGSGGGGVGVNASAIYSANGSLNASDFIQGGISTGLAVLTDGRIVVVGPGGTSVPSTATTGNVFSSAGQSLGNFSVPHGFSTVYLDQSIAASNNGGFVVGYTKASSYSSAGLELEGFDSSLSRVWAVTLAPETSNRTGALKLSVESGTGRIAAAWITSDQNPSIKWALLDSVGQTIKPEQTISVPTGGNGGGLHALTWLTGNRLVITFNDGQGQAQYAQFFDNSGNSLSSLVRVSQDAPLSGGVSGSITPPSVTELSGGNLVFAWQSIRTDGSTDVRIRITDSQGSPLGDEKVISPLVGNQLNPMVVAQGGNSFALLWVDAANSTPVLNSMIVDASSPSNLAITAGNTGSFALVPTSVLSSDTTPPLIAISSNQTSISSSQTATITFTLSEPTTNFSASDILVWEGEVTNFAGSGNLYTASFVPSVNNGRAIISVASNTFSDAVGNFNTDGSDQNNTISIQIGSPPPNSLSFTKEGQSFQLISPVVTSSGKTYYWLDLSRDGTATGDTLNHNDLDLIFNAGNNTTVNLNTRSFSQNGYTVILPTYAEVLDLISDKSSKQPYNWGGYYLLADEGGNGHRDAVFNYSTMTGSAASSSTQETAPGGAIVEVISSSFSYSSASSGTTTPIDPTTPICFTRGTRIQIGEQSKPVETLSISNQVSTATASAAVKWIGYQRRTPEFAQFQDYLPVKISAGALDDHVPLRDLYLSPDHAVLVDGHLIHAKALVNGKTIVQMTEWAGDIEYYHIETEAHEIIYAEGVPCETFIDNVSREQFDNYAEYQALYPNTRMMKELPLPRVKFKRQLPTMIKQRLESRISELDRQHKG